MLKLCVTAPIRTRLTLAMRSASGVSSEIVPPYSIVDGASAIVGRGPLNRYGGENTSAVVSSTICEPSSRPLPASSTRPSGSSSEELW